MKKLLIPVLVIALLAVGGATAVFAEQSEQAPASVEVFVTIASAEKLVLVNEKITVTDADGDGKLTVNDALFCAHEAKFEGGAQAGYASEPTQYGLSLVRLWGVVHPNGYGYFVDHTSAMSLADPVSDGSRIDVFMYRDGVKWSDVYCYFDQAAVSTEQPGEVTLTLTAIVYDETYQPVAVPVVGAVVTVNGTAVDVHTDEDGKATLSFEKGGSYLVSAYAEGETILVPPACVVTVRKEADAPVAPGKDQPQAPDNAERKGPGKTEACVLAIYIGIAAVAAVIDGVVSRRRYE